MQIILLYASKKFNDKYNPEIYREAVHGRLRRVHDEVTQGEAEPLGSATQTHGLRPRP